MYTVQHLVRPAWGWAICRKIHQTTARELIKRLLAAHPHSPHQFDHFLPSGPKEELSGSGHSKGQKFGMRWEVWWQWEELVGRGTVFSHRHILDVIIFTCISTLFHRGFICWIFHAIFNKPIYLSLCLLCYCYKAI